MKKFIFKIFYLLFQIKLTRLIFLFKAVLRKQHLDRFWIKDMSDIRGSDLKSVTIEFNDADETQRAFKVFRSFEYRNGKDLYPINSYLESERPRRKQDRFDSYSRGRSRSPHYESSKLDVSYYKNYTTQKGPFKHKRPPKCSGPNSW